MRQREEQDQQRKGEGKKERSCQTQFQDGITKRGTTHKRCLKTSRSQIPIQIYQIMQLIIYATV